MIESVILAITLIATVLFITTTINSWVGMIVVKENYVDRNWVGRFFNLLIAVVGWVIWFKVW